MAINKHVECYDCEAVFKIKHDLDPNFYKLSVCPFCGTNLEEEESFDQEEEE